MDLQPLPTGVSVVVPVYNSEATIGDLADRLAPVLAGVAPGAYELILVNDGSRDGSWREVERAAERHDWVRGVDLFRNFGQHNALLGGIRMARFDKVITMDDDLQHPPEEIPKLLAALEDGAEVAYGVTADLPHSRMRNLMSRLTKRTLARAMGVGSVRDISAFRALRTHLRDASATYSGPTLVLDALLSWGTAEFATVEVRHEPRRVGQSNYTVGKLINQAMLVLTGFSTKPLRMASLIGFAFTTLGFVVLVYVFAVYLSSQSIPGFPFLASLIAIFGGVQLFALGIFGEYLASVFERSMGRPPYLVRTVTERSTEQLAPGREDVVYLPSAEDPASTTSHVLP